MGGPTNYGMSLQRYNAGDVDGVMELMDPNAQYHDMIYLEPFKGAKEVRRYFDKVTSIVPGDLKFCVEDITDGDPRKVGVKWHVELNGYEFPFSRGASFYEVTEQGQILYGRDLVEPAVKPGSSALLALKLLTPLIRKLGPNANPGKLKELPVKGGLMWAFFAGYMGFVFFSTVLPGPAIWQTPPEVFKEVFYESVDWLARADFFYINNGLTALGISPIPSTTVHPVSLGIFNFVNAWSMMFWPVMLADKKGQAVKQRFPLWFGTQFLTNVFFIPYMAVRQFESKTKPNLAAPGCDPKRLPPYASVLAVVGVIVGVATFFWMPLAHPEYGSIADRWDFFLEACTLNRAFFAFVLDMVLYSVFQSVLLANAPPAYRYTPFFGLAAWLIAPSEVELED
ncbi:g2491 [Coccomyxa viridis]|uniref:G2491 protein n=1 Tax=Coccomyxa viridis TaxID=1274662 RepID=A0ABP1FQQ6_9CHLO